MEIQTQKTINAINPKDSEVMQQTKINLEQKPDEVILNTDKSKKKSKKKTAAKVLIGLGIVAAAGIAIYKGKQIKALKEIPAELKPLFNELKGKNGIEFVDDAYSGLVKYMDLDGIAPSKVHITGNSDGAFNTIIGGFNQIENTIQYTKGFIDKLTKKQQFNLLSHELKHCKQFNQILQTEGLGAEVLAKVQAEQTIYKGSGFFGNYSEKIMRDYPKEEAKKIIKDKIEELSKEYLNKIEINFSKTLKKPKLSSTSPEGLKSKEYLEAVRNYTGLGFMGTKSKEYLENLLEKEAYAFGDKMGKQFGTSQTVPVKIKDFFRVLKNSIKES